MKVFAMLSYMGLLLFVVGLFNMGPLTVWIKLALYTVLVPGAVAAVSVRL